MSDMSNKQYSGDSWRRSRIIVSVCAVAITFVLLAGRPAMAISGPRTIMMTLTPSAPNKITFGSPMPTPGVTATCSLYTGTPQDGDINVCPGDASAVPPIASDSIAWSISGCATCTIVIFTQYPNILAGDPINGDMVSASNGTLTTSLDSSLSNETLEYYIVIKDAGGNIYTADPRIIVGSGSGPSFIIGEIGSELKDLLANPSCKENCKQLVGQLESITQKLRKLFVH